MFSSISAYCEAGYVQYEGKNFSFPETWSGQLVNSISTCPDSGLWLWGQEMDALVHFQSGYDSTI